ncbi:MAG: MFS transporter [Prevotella sp.]|nr:MFS transporter [Prevotella sp.]
MERLWNSNYIKVMTANFALFFAFYILTPLLPLYLSEHFGATKDIIGMVLSGYTIMALLFRPISGYLVDTFPRKTVLLTCFFFFFVFFGCYLAAGTLMVFAIVRTLHGGPFGALTVANSTVAIDTLPLSRRNEGIGYYGLSNNLAMALAPTIGLYVYRSTSSFDLLFWIALVVALLGMVIDATVKVEPLPPSSIQSDKGSTVFSRLFYTKGWAIGVNMVFFGFCFGVLSNYLAIYSKESLGITGGTGTYFMLLSCGLIVSRLFGRKALQQGRLTHNAAEGMLISLVGYFIFVAWPTHISYYLSAILIGLGNGHLWPAFLNMIISTASEKEHGAANSTLLVAWDVGIGLGILLGGIIAEHIGFNAAFWSVSAINGMGVAMFFAITKKHFMNRNRIKTNK